MNRRFTTLTLTALACAVVASAQTSSTAGAVRGLVKNKAGQIVVGAQVSLRNRETGLVRTTATNTQGEYHIGLLPVGNYELTLTATGMRTVKDTAVTVSLGQNTVANFNIDKAEASAMVEIVASASSLDTTQINSVTAIDSKLVESIPINGRDFTNLVQLTPGAAPTDAGTTSMGGARGIQNNLTIDGASYNSGFFGEQRGSTRIPFTFGADTIKELQIITNAYDAQYGNASGAVINAVTKTGTNEFGGSALYQIRPESMVAKIRPVPYDPRGTTNTPQAETRSFTQSQYNLNVGGALIKDKLHYFVGVEILTYRADFTPNFGVASSGGNIAANLNTFLTNFGGLKVGDDGRTLAQEGGRPYTNDRKNTVVFARLDWTINENHRATLRMNSQDWKSTNGTTDFTSSSAPTTGQTQQGTEKDSGLSWVLELNSILGTNVVNEARVQRAIERRPRIANTVISPEFGVSNGFFAGELNFLPNGLDEYSWQIVDNITWNQGDWTVKGGLDLQMFDFTNTFFRYQNGSFVFGDYGVANRWASHTLASGDNATYTGSFSNYGGAIAYKSQLLAGYVQGQYSGLLDHRLLLSLGLRVTEEKQPDNPRPQAQFGGLDQANTNTSTDPRFGFTYDLTGKGKTILRGGYGWFSNANPSLTVSNTMNSNGNTTSTYAIKDSSATLNTLFNTGLLSSTSRITSNVLSRLDPTLLAGLGTASRTGQVWDPENKMSVAKRSSLGIEHAYNNGLTLGVQGIYAKFEHLQNFINISLNQVGAPAGSFYNDGYAVPGLNTFSTAGRPNKAIIRGRLLDFTNFGDVFLSENNGEGTYKAIVLTASMRSDNGWGFTSNVTWAQARDNNSNERTTASNSSDSNNNNPSNPLATMAYSDNDRPFRFIFAGYFPVYFGIKGAANFSYTSGRPYSAIASGDLNGDGGRNDYMVGTVRNGFRQPSVKTLDLRLDRDFAITPKFHVDAFMDVFNVLNWANMRTSITTGQPTTDFGFINLPDRNTREVQFGVRAKF
jgi:hypothetical protein